jgi:methylated-DNA-protein-cysteine methyltransferase-like protein
VPEPIIDPGSDFRDKVWAFVRSVPQGKVVTYGQVAAMLGFPFAARAVGSVLHYTPSSAEVPCQRVVNRWGRLAPSYGWGGAEQHKRELEDDGVQVRPDYTVDLLVYQWWPDPLTQD